MHFSWIAFFATYAAAIGASVVYALPTLVLLTIAAIRGAAWLRGRRHQRALSQAAAA
jgi:hypothetical protein